MTWQQLSSSWHEDVVKIPMGKKRDWRDSGLGKRDHGRSQKEKNNIKQSIQTVLLSQLLLCQDPTFATSSGDQTQRSAINMYLFCRNWIDVPLSESRSLVLQSHKHWTQCTHSGVFPPPTIWKHLSCSEFIPKETRAFPNLYCHKYRHSNRQFICIYAERCRNNPPTATRTISMAAAGWRPTNSPRLCNKLFYSREWNYHWADCCWNK